MQTSPIPPNSKSYPTHAVIIYHGITDGDERTAVWMLSWAIYNALRANQHPQSDPEVNRRYNALVLMSNGDRVYRIADHLRENHIASIASFMAEAKSA